MGKFSTSHTMAVQRLEANEPQHLESPERLGFGRRVLMFLENQDNGIEKYRMTTRQQKPMNHHT